MAVCAYFNLLNSRESHAFLYYSYSPIKSRLNLNSTFVMDNTTPETSKSSAPVAPGQ
jgi:hypothetical protein